MGLFPNANTAISRWRRPLLLATSITIFLLVLRQTDFSGYSLTPRPQPQPELLEPVPEPLPPTLHVAIVNAPDYHFEVAIPLLYTFSRQERVSHLELIATETASNKFGAIHFLEEAVNPSLGALNIQSPKSVNDDLEWLPDVMVLTSCMHDLSKEHPVPEVVDRVLSNSPHSVAVCILHEVFEWQNATSPHRKFAHKWGPHGKFKFMVLSEHVKKRLQEELKIWGIGEVEILPPYIPVFPLSHEALGYDPEKPQQKAMGIPGKYEPHRRSYQPVFESFVKHAQTFQRDNVSLNLVGFGKHPSPIDDTITDLVHFHDKLDFDAYWATLSSCLAIATAFASDHYIKDKASSTVPTAFIAGVPIICGKDVLEAYTYLREDSVWLLEPGEGIADGFMRVLEKSPQEWIDKRRKVEERRDECQNESIRDVDEFLGRLAVKSTPQPGSNREQVIGD